MLRTSLLPRLALAVALAACGGKDSKPDVAAAPGPIFSPIIANSLRAIAPDCKLERVGAIEHRECVGRYGTVSIALGAGNRFTSLTIALPPKLLAEAKSHFGHGLKEALGQAGVDTLLAALATLETGQAADLTIDNAKIHVTAGGRSKIAPEYTVAITWF